MAAGIEISTALKLLALFSQLVVYVNPMSRAWNLSVDEHAKSHGTPRRCWSHDEMKIAAVKAVHDVPIEAPGDIQRT